MRACDYSTVHALVSVSGKDLDHLMERIFALVSCYPFIVGSVRHNSIGTSVAYFLGFL